MLYCMHQNCTPVMFGYGFPSCRHVPAQCGFSARSNAQKKACTPQNRQPASDPGTNTTAVSPATCTKPLSVCTHCVIFQRCLSQSFTLTTALKLLRACPGWPYSSVRCKKLPRRITASALQHSHHTAPQSSRSSSAVVGY